MISIHTTGAYPILTYDFNVKENCVQMLDYISSLHNDSLCLLCVKRYVLIHHTISNFRAPAVPSIAKSLHTTTFCATLGLTVYLLGFAVGPFIWAPLSEGWGRRPVYLVSWAGFVVFQIPCALAINPG